MHNFSLDKAKLPLMLAALLAFFILLTHTSRHSVSANSASGGYVFRRSFGNEGTKLSLLHDVAIAPDGTVYIVEYRRVVAIRPGPERSFFTWEAQGTGIGVDQDGYVYVSDSYNNRIQKFTATGEYVTEWGEQGDGIGQFNEPDHLAIDRNNFIYVTDKRNRRVQKFTSDGEYVTQWNSRGNPGDLLPYVFGIATDASNNVYVTQSDGRIVKFTSNGQLLAEWFIEVDVGFPTIPDLAVDTENNVYVAVYPYGSSIQHHIQKFTADGVYLLSWGASGADPGQFNYPVGMATALDSSGAIVVYVVDNGNRRVQMFRNDGTYRSQLGDRIEPGQFIGAHAIDIDPYNQLYVGTNEDHLLKLQTNGTLVAGVQNYQASRFAVDSVGNIYIVGGGDHTVRKYDNDFNFILQWGTFGSGNGQFQYPLYIATDSSDNIYVTELLNDRVQKFDSNGNYLSQWGETGSGNGQFVSPRFIAIDDNDIIYVADYGNQRIQLFATDGTYLTQWPGVYGIIGTDTSGYIFVSWELAIRKFTSSGTQVTEWESPWPGEASRLGDVAVDSYGNVYATNNLAGVLVFSPTHPAPDPVSGLILDGSFEQTAPALREWTRGGYLLVSQSSQSSHGQYAMRLGQPVPAQPQGESQAWAHQTIYVDPTWQRPFLTFQYNMFVNDIIDYSDFTVAIHDGIGQNHLATVLRDGYRSCIPNVAPPAGTSLGWRDASYDLSAFKGEYIRIVFRNRNLWPDSWGIWTLVDDVRVVDAGPPPVAGAERTFLPALSGQQCDSLVGMDKNPGEADGSLHRPVP